MRPCGGPHEAPRLAQRLPPRGRALPGGEIGVYVWGPTIDHRIHVGNARPVVVFLQIKRYLEWRGRPVHLVQNITDINDKITSRPGKGSTDILAALVSRRSSRTPPLGLGRPDNKPLASETIPQIVALIEELIAAGTPTRRAAMSTSP